MINRVIISGGGTAGHIYPALAVAQELRERGVEILFVGALGKMEMERVPKAGFRIVGLPIAGLQRRLTLRNLLVPLKMLKSMAMARRIIKDFNPDVVVGFGGYASAPVLRTAQRLGVRTVIQEQNSYAGLTNKMLAKRADKICTAYEGMERFFAPE
ncbi:MAG: glycosyltransferase, partial [Mucinivorans sp.]